MDFFNTLLTPLRWVIEFIVVTFHTLLTNIGLSETAGITWMLSIVGLVIVVKTVLMPVTLSQLRSQDKVAAVVPQVKALELKYRGRKDAASRDELARETFALYKAAGTNPLLPFIPIFVQTPVFVSLFAVLTTAVTENAGVGLFTRKLATQFAEATFFGAQLPENFIGAIGLESNILIIVPIAILIMSVFQFGSFRFNYKPIQQAIAQVKETDAVEIKEQHEEAIVDDVEKESIKKASGIPKKLQTGIPFIFITITAIASIVLPLALLTYTFTSSAWTVVQKIVLFWIAKSKDEKERVAAEIAELEKEIDDEGEETEVIIEHTEEASSEDKSDK
jgi:YidC/Oxa1 family membrane protein insertase